jgi:hypothetical protein
MPRYYLHIRSKDGLSKDLQGEELPNIEAAQAAALRVIRRIRASKLWGQLLPEAHRQMAIEIADETDQTLLIVPFARSKRRIH